MTATRPPMDMVRNGRQSTSKPSVLHVGKFYPPSRGGMESHLALLARELRRSAKVEVVVSATTKATSHELVDGVSLTRIGTMFRLAGASISPGMRDRIVR